jgi:flagellar motor switch protein FliM
MSDTPLPTDSEPSPSEAAPRAPLVLRSNGTRFPLGRNVSVQPFDFRTPRFLGEAELSRLRLLSQQFVGSLGGRLAAFLRTEFNLKFVKLTTEPYVEFTRSLPSPTHLTLFKAEPLPGVGVIEMSPKLALAMTNRMLGGRGEVADADRHLTEIEIALLEEVLRLVIEEWCLQWREYCNVEGSQLGHESNARFLQGSSGDTMMVLVSLEASFGGKNERFQVAVPALMIEPLVKAIQEARRREMPVEPPKKPKQWRKAYDHIAVPVVADWLIRDLTVADILQMRVGDVMQLPRTTLDNTRLCVSNLPQFIGRAGCENGKVAVQIQRNLTQNPAA